MLLQGDHCDVIEKTTIRWKCPFFNNMATFPLVDLHWSKAQWSYVVLMFRLSKTKSCSICCFAGLWVRAKGIAHWKRACLLGDRDSGRREHWKLKAGEQETDNPVNSCQLPRIIAPANPKRKNSVRNCALPVL